MKKRPSWDEYLGQITLAVATRGACNRRQHGALIVQDKRILTTGYNGPPTGVEHCDVRCYREEHNIEPGTRYEMCRSIHAEMNAILQAAIYGIPIKYASIYVTDVPCLMCARIIMQCQLREIVLVNITYDYSHLDILQEHGIIVRRLNVSDPEGTINLSGVVA